MTAQRKTVLSLLGVGTLGVLAILALLPPARGGIIARALPRIRLGLDLQGGTQLTYEADMKEIPPTDQTTALEGVRDVIERRINAFGIAEPIVQVLRGGAPRVIVELAGVHDVDAAVRQIGETPQLDFREEAEVSAEPSAPTGEGAPVPRPVPRSSESEVGSLEGEGGPVPRSSPEASEVGWKRTDLTGRHLKRADVTFDPNTGQAQVALVFDSEGKDLFAQLTERSVGKRIAIFLDGVAITAPVVQEKISAGEAVITGDFSVPEAKQLATRLNAGALPVPITLVTRTTIGPSLGRESLAKSILAGIIGIAAIIVIMVGLYRLPGVVAIVSLSLYALIFFSILQALGATLTLAGIAGVILSFGMAVDANILIFERLREELRTGRALAGAILEGFREAWPSIRDSNVASLITASLLYAFGSSVVRGFATTLAIGITVSMFTGIVVTRTLLRSLALVRAFQRNGWYVPAPVLPVNASAPPGTAGLIAKSRLWLSASALMLAASVVAVAAWGIRPGIDFTGGSLLELRGAGVTVTAVRDALGLAGEVSALVQDTGSGTTLVRLRPLSTEDHTRVLSQLTTQNAKLTELRFETVGPTIGRELLRKALIATLLSVVLILTYLAWAFQRATLSVSPWAFGTIAVVALIHDLVIMTGFFTLLARFRGASADSLFLTAALTLLGFSVHDTIVVFNRVKSNLLRLRIPFRDLVARSVTETITRSVNTSATTLVVLLALAFFGGATTRPFVATLSAGIVVGTYSSIFIASPLLVWWQSRRTLRRA